MKKITIISQYWEPDMNGDVVRLKNYIGLLLKLGFEITLITAIPNYLTYKRKEAKVGIEKRERLKIIRLWMPKLVHKGLASRLILYLSFMIFASLPTLIYARKSYIWAFSQRVFSTLAALPAKLLFRVKLYSDITDIWPEALINTDYASEDSLFYKMGRFIAKIAYRSSDKILVLSEDMKKQIANRYGLDPKRVFVLENFMPSREIDLPNMNGELRVLYYGNLGKNYDFDAIIELAKELKREKIKFIIIGSGEMEYEIIENIKRNGLTNVEFINRMLEEAKLKAFVKDAQVLILPMRHQVIEDVSFPTKLIDYLHSGRVILYIGNGYCLRLINGHKAGIGLDKFEKEKLVDFLRTLSNNAEMIKEYATNAKRLAEEMFSEMNATAKIKILFQ
ncbi:MAG TPA: glycosyltransferase family 4 protein [Geobacterales bacterium]|nr:glycosyltransferase family 4 protein [Geobacterales bacterium]